MPRHSITSKQADKPPSLLTLAARELAAEAAKARLARYWDDPALFAAECIAWAPGEGPTDYQLAILRELPRRRRVAVRGPHGLGKTALAAWAVLWFAITRNGLPGEDWKVVTTASAWRQLDHYLWPELHKWARCLDWKRIGRERFDERTELLQVTLKLARGEAFAAASDRADLIEGAHADTLLCVRRGKGHTRSGLGCSRGSALIWAVPCPRHLDSGRAARPLLRDPQSKGWLRGLVGAACHTGGMHECGPRFTRVGGTEGEAVGRELRDLSEPRHG